MFGRMSGKKVEARARSATVAKEDVPAAYGRMNIKPKFKIMAA
jgi:hypothetical protein